MMRLKELFQDYEKYRLTHSFSGDPTKLYDAMEYIMQLGGKRARPLLVLSTCAAAGGSTDHALPVAHAIEVFHNFSLVHDDIMDRADIRRGNPTVHQRWNPATAILAGDNMLVAAYDILLQADLLKRDDILRLFTQTARGVCEGQQMDMDFAESLSVREVDYLEMIRLKTAVLLGCAAASGALCANADAEKTSLYYRFAVAMGMSFQLRDDYLDIFGDVAKTGKKAGGDIAERKKTWFFIKAASVDESIHGLYAIEDESERIQKVTAMYRELKLDEALYELASGYEIEAGEHLQVLGNLGEDVQILKKLQQFLAERDG